MAGKLIDLERAAKMLGVSEAELNQMRISGEVHGVRDGADWKFKQEELERVAEERGAPLAGDASADGGMDDLLDVGDLEAGDSSALDLSEEVEDADESPTAIGSLEQFEAAGTGESGLEVSGQEDDDLTIGDDEEVEAPAGGSDVLGESQGSDVMLGLDSDKDVLADSGTSLSDVALVPDDSGSGLDLVADSSADVLSGTDVRLDGTGSGGTGGTGAGGSDELDFEGSGIAVGSDLSLEADQELAIGEAEEDELTIGDEEELALGEEDELALEGGSDVTRGAGDSGINVASPSDSGLNLEEEPLDLVGSSVSSLELPEDDMIDLEDLDAGPDDATQLQVDEDFQLAPSMEAEVDDEEDSGSQVIALEDSEAFEQAGGAAVAAVEPMAAEDSDELEGALDDFQAAPVTQPALPDSALVRERPEMPYSIWNILSLLTIVILLALTGMLMTDLVRNMWTWEGPYTASSPLMDMMVRLLGLEP